MDIFKIIQEKRDNIGSLCLFINKRPELLKIIDKYIEKNKIVDNLSLSQKIYIYYNKYHDIYCQCGNIKSWRSFKHGFNRSCGNNICIKNITNKTNIDKYGVDNPMKNEDIKNKLKNTNLKKYGFSSASKNKKVKEKISEKLNNRTKTDKKITKEKRIDTWNKKSDKEKNIIIKKIKYSNINKTIKDKEKVKEKRKNTCLKKYGSEYAITSVNIRNKILKIFNDKYGSNTPFSNKKVRNKASMTYSKNHVQYIKENIKKFNCEYIRHFDKGNSNIEYELLCLRKNKKFKIGYSNLRNRIISKNEISPFFRKENGISEMEKSFLLNIEKYYNNKILLNSKNIISPYELDMYLPDLKMAFEFNGLWWHNELYKDKNYHLNKTEECEKQGIQLIHIYEDDWIYKQEIVKSIILNKIDKSFNKIYARKTEVKEVVDNKLVREFLEKNHIQGFVGSSVKLGLFYENELVSLMTFGKRRVAMGKKKSNDNEYELLRFCNKLNTNVIGGASKLFKYFIKNYNPNKIITYADRSYSKGKLYEKLGFKYKGKTQPNYYYVIDGIRNHRFNFRKDILVKEGYDSNKTEHEIMLERNIFRIYNSGNLKFEY